MSDTGEYRQKEVVTAENWEEYDVALKNYFRVLGSQDWKVPGMKAVPVRGDL